MRILVISPHPDDETLGCGGTLLKHKHQGDELTWLIVTQTTSPKWSDSVIAEKAAEVARVEKLYNFSRVYKLGLPSTELDAIPKHKLITRLEEALADVRPDWIYTVGSYDIHSDHHAVFEAVMIATKPFKREAGVKRIMTYEVLSSTDAASFRRDGFSPNCYVDISKYVETKLEIMQAYETELQSSPLPRSLEAIRALARYRGATIGVEYAEAFQIIREVL